MRFQRSRACLRIRGIFSFENAVCGDFLRVRKLFQKAKPGFRIFCMLIADEAGIHYQPFSRSQQQFADDEACTSYLK